jgi:hypothetical protein
MFSKRHHHPSGGRSRHDIPTQNISAAKFLRWGLAKSNSSILCTVFAFYMKFVLTRVQSVEKGGKFYHF